MLFREAGKGYKQRNKIPQQSDAPLPRIQVQNDQYRPPPPPQPPAAVLPYPTYAMPAPAPQPQYVYPPQPQPSLQQPIYYPPVTPEPEPIIQRTVPNVDPNARARPSQSSYRRESSDPYPRERSEDHGVKRKSTGATGGGPLKLSSTNTVPVLAVGERRQQADRPSSHSRSAKEEPPAKKPREDIDENNVISPLQGYKIVITNLHVTVTQDDIIVSTGGL